MVNRVSYELELALHSDSVDEENNENIKKMLVKKISGDFRLTVLIFNDKMSFRLH